MYESSQNKKFPLVQNGTNFLIQHLFKSVPPFLDMIPLQLILVPVTGFIIGAFTNYLAVKMLFHPKKKILGIQGIIPKRKKILAQKVSEAAPLIMPPYFRKIEKIPFIGNKILNTFKRGVEEQINNLSDDELEKIVLQVMKKEMQFIVWIGGVIGLIIGCLQLLIM